MSTVACGCIAKRSGAKQVDDWLCPTPYSQTTTSTRRRSGTAAVDRPSTGQRHRSTVDQVRGGGTGAGVQSTGQRHRSTDDQVTGAAAAEGQADGDEVDGLTMNLLLITISVLLVLLVVVGLASYCRAVHS